MIRPRASPTSGWVSIWRTAARHSRYGPRRLTAIIASQSSGSVSSSGLECAPASTALFTITSSDPVRSTAVATSPRSRPVEATSAVDVHGAAAAGRDHVLGRLAAGDRIAADVGQHDVEPVGREPDRDRPADPRRRPRDDGAARSFHLLPVPILPDARRRIRRPLPAQPELQDRRRRPLPRRLLAARRGAARARLADRADALPRARVHRPEPLLGGQGAARHDRLSPPLPAASPRPSPARSRCTSAAATT